MQVHKCQLFILPIGLRLASALVGLSALLHYRRVSYGIRVSLNPETNKTRETTLVQSINRKSTHLVDCSLTPAPVPASHITITNRIDVTHRKKRRPDINLRACQKKKKTIDDPTESVRLLFVTFEIVYIYHYVCTSSISYIPENYFLQPM